MSETDAKPKKLVREFRQILVWPIQLMPLREGAQIQEHWEALSQPGTDHPWRELRDEFSCDPTQFQQRHYSEFVTFLPYVRRFLYGEGKGRTDAGVVDSPIRVFRRNDVAALRATFPGAQSVPLTVSIAHVDLFCPRLHSSTRNRGTRGKISAWLLFPSSISPRSSKAARRRRR